MADKKEIPFALLEILTKYSDEEHVLTAREIMTLLENEYDLSIERRTLYANVELLQKYGHKISTWQENGYGYYLKEHQFKQSEVLLLCNAIHSSNFISPKESSELIKKLLSTLSNSQKKDYTDKVYLPKSGKTSNNILLDNLSLLSNAIRDRRPIRFIYLQYDSHKNLVPRREKPYETEPRFLVYKDSRAYLITTSDHHEGFAHYRIDRIADLEIINDRKVPVLSKDLDAYEYSRNMFYMFNDEFIDAVIRCETRVLDHVIDIFGTDCRILPFDEDYFDLHIKGSTQGILLFAQQYLDAIEIIEPAGLRKDFYYLLTQSSRRHKG